MNTTSSNLFIWVGEQAACIRVTGRASFTTSVDFKKLMQHLQQTGPARVVLDLSECLLMDSTFLGVLASEGHKRIVQQGPQPEPGLELLNPNQRIRDLIDNLGVSHLFKMTHYDLAQQDFKPVEPQAGVSREEITRTCLEAHQTLMALNPANVAKFKEVAQFFAENLQRTREEPRA
ncbi:MAG: STAS domain-containing protein [Verrucomicrobia bacterium]|nr:STAS domain-containing protein [Verrucomicrobiota bacterium]